ncbi:MAG: hypothetical protein HQL21_01280 [Candidatus Omnitrophica bacterium]|nr:hypothetical protein [Candidatus Omnitrophota bacterium]
MIQWGRSFYALSFSVFIHIVFLGLFVLSCRGEVKDFKIDFFFWGGILRHQELLPVLSDESQNDGRVRIDSPSAIWAPVQMVAWRLGSSVEKPELFKVREEDKSLPSKFMTARVELDVQDQLISKDSQLGIPEAPKVYFRRPEP